MLAELAGQVRPAPPQEAKMAASGPIPKRAAERRRVNTTTEAGVSLIPTAVPVVAEDMDIRPVEMPEPGEKWHPIAVDTYESFGHSGMRIFYEPSDWMRLFWLCDQLSQNLKPQFCGISEVSIDQDGETSGGGPIMEVKVMAGSTITAMLRGFASAGASEGDRRQMRIELERGASMPDADKTEADILAFRAGLV